MRQKQSTFRHIAKTGPKDGLLAQGKSIALLGASISNDRRFYSPARSPKDNLTATELHFIENIYRLWRVSAKKFDRLCTTQEDLAMSLAFADSAFLRGEIGFGRCGDWGGPFSSIWIMFNIRTFCATQIFCEWSGIFRRRWAAFALTSYGGGVASIGLDSSILAWWKRAKTPDLTISVSLAMIFYCISIVWLYKEYRSIFAFWWGVVMMLKYRILGLKMVISTYRQSPLWCQIGRSVASPSWIRPLVSKSPFGRFGPYVNAKVARSPL